MAAPGLIRLRLVFDYPPPSAADCRRCWLLVDRSRCRVVADVESLVRERFNFSRWSVFSLFVEECYLPSTESVHVLRDNDCVSVKVDYLSPSDELSCSPHPTVDRRQKKRLRDGGEDEERVEPVERKRKKRKAGSEERSRGEDGEKKKKKKNKKAKTVSEGSVPLGSDDPQKQEIQPKKKKKKNRGPEPTPPAAVSTTSRKLTVTPPKVSANGSMTKQSSTKSSSTKAPLKTKSNAAPSSSSDTDSSSTAVETSESSSKPLLNGLQKGAAPTLDLPDANSEEEIQLVIHTPVLGLGRGNFGRGFIPRGRGDGRGRVEGRGRGYRGHNISMNGTKEAPTETSIPVKLQNGAPPTAKQDYSSMPLLAGPPQVGQKIAFKLLELSESYTPEVSEYKEGKIISFNPVTKQIELELLTALAAPTEPGKFDLVYQNADGSESVEYAVSRSSRVTERWESLLEPRLVLHTPLQESLP
ncbi:coilin [Gouania willdenowi]|uniref:coilin n=1 Tax=Gouania willdenowi TaxID=441366 RepID=UPI0010562EF4|nr:coilin [Gouania willdenowi]